MEQRSSDAAEKDAQINPDEEEYAGVTVHTAISIEESAADFASYFESDFDRTTLTRPNQRTATTSASQGSVPEEVVVCEVSANNQVVEV